ncbi:hypothetical protein KY290_032381 [Solanum tuberosum]|uniref:Uncharacterized protein n=1 Tax=Solanum tuberosum TaxID=4113 RepID=A0ABQ7UBZ7_SOLTU|nr:hypothetical protein KY290_032381 [Solanum tuberosum]
MIYIPLVPITVNRFASRHNPGLLESICFWNEKLLSELRLLRERYVNILGFPFQNVDVSSGLKDAKDDAGDPESRHKGMLETENLVNELKKYAVTISWEGMFHVRDANQEGGVVAFTGATISTDADLLA